MDIVKAFKFPAPFTPPEFADPWPSTPVFPSASALARLTDHEAVDHHQILVHDLHLDLNITG